MKPPRANADPEDRHLECQEAIEPLVIVVIDEARAAGWTIAQIATALIDVADNQMLADAANRKLDQHIEAALKRLGL